MISFSWLKQLGWCFILSVFGLNLLSATEVDSNFGSEKKESFEPIKKFAQMVIVSGP